MFHAKRSSKGLLTGLALCSLFLATPNSSLAGDYYEGGYVAPDGLDTVWSFISKFNYNQYYYTYEGCWTHANNSYTDAMDFAFYCGHGAPYYISQYDRGVSLSNAGNTGALGLGNWSAEFVAFHSCKVVPSPLERSDWWSAWVGSNGIFDGLHQVVGFRTDAFIATAPSIAGNFGSQLKNDGYVWISWFDAIDRKGRSNEHGCAVMHPSTIYDTYRYWAADPPRDHQDLYVWWQY